MHPKHELCVTKQCNIPVLCSECMEEFKLTVEKGSQRLFLHLFL